MRLLGATVSSAGWVGASTQAATRPGRPIFFHYDHMFVRNTAPVKEETITNAKALI